MTPLIWFTLACAGGILLAQAALFSPVWLLLALPTALVLWAGWGDERWARRGVVVALGLLLGAGRFWIAQPRIDAAHVAYYNRLGPATLEGVIRTEADRRPTYTNLRLDVERVTFPNGETREVYGSVLLKAPAYTPADYGDRISATGLLEEPPVFESFSYRDYLARQGIHALLRRAEITVLASQQANPALDALFRFKAHALQLVHTLLPEPQSSLLAGILLGVETGISADLNADFSATGTSHIVAISGFNLTIIAGVFAAAAKRGLGERGETWPAVGGVWLYTVLVGASAAVVRAAVMASVALLARRADRKTHGPTSLATAALLMALLNPYILWDVGFQLSVAATAGLIFYTDPLTRAFLRFFEYFAQPEAAERIVGWLSDAIIVTLAAQITTMPIMMGVFRHISLVTLLTNFLILPVQAYVMFFGGVALLLALVIYPVGQLVAWVAWVFLAYTIEMVRLTAQIPFASLPLGRVTLPLVWGYYALLAAGTWWWAQPVAARQAWWMRARRVAQWQIAAGAAIAILLIVAVLSLPDGRLHVYFLDVGHGDAIFVRTPGGRQVLIDGGPDAPQTLAHLGRRMPFWDRRLDMVALTSPNAGRVAGLVPVLERYQVDFVAVGAEAGRGSVFERWNALLAERPAGSVGNLWAGVAWELEPGLTLHAYWPRPEDPAGPVVLRLVYHETSILLPGDATTLVEEALVAAAAAEIGSSVLLLPRHGAATAATPAFLQAVNPEIVVISVGADNPRGDPAPAVLARVLDKPVYRTDRHGVIEIISDGRTLQVRTER